MASSDGPIGKTRKQNLVVCSIKAPEVIKGAGVHHNSHPAQEKHYR
jgi:hypothetical protein